LRTAADSIDAALDAALDMTFPASDPIAIFMPDSDGRTVVADQSSPIFNGTRVPPSHRQQAQLAISNGVRAACV